MTVAPGNHRSTEPTSVLDSKVKLQFLSTHVSHNLEAVACLHLSMGTSWVVGVQARYRWRAQAARHRVPA